MYSGGKIIFGAGPQTVPASFLDSDVANSLSSYVPDFDVFLRDSEVPSPSNIYGSTLFVDSPDYSLLNTMEDSYQQFGPSSVTDCNKFYELKPSSNSTSTLVLSSPSPQDTIEEIELQMEEFGTSFDMFSASLAANIKKEPEEAVVPMTTCNNNNEYYGSVHIKKEMLEEYEESSDDFKSLVMQHLTRDIDVACENLRISRDPTKWSVEDVRSWLVWALRQNNLPQIPLQYFVMDGLGLCSLTEDNFRQWTPHGETLYALLYIWKTAASYEEERNLTRTPSPEPGVPIFKPEDSMLDMSSFLQWDSIPSPPIPSTSIERSATPDQHLTACVPDVISSATNHSTEYSSDSGFQSDDDISEEDGLDIDKPNRQNSHSHIHLWQFLKELLMHPQSYSSCIRWLDRSKGVFKIEDSVRVAKLWGKRKNRPAMNYDKLSRSIRQYYKKGIMKKTERSQRLVYQFCHPYCL